MIGDPTKFGNRNYKIINCAGKYSGFSHIYIYYYWLKNKTKLGKKMVDNIDGNVNVALAIQTAKE